MQCPGDSGGDAGQGLEPLRHHLQYQHKRMLRRGSQWHEALNMLAKMQVKDWPSSPSLAMPS